jgi:putative Mg2+ transporter-C (MgtC) family protein
MTLVAEDVLKLVLAIFLGGLIGAEREFRDKAAGFRTIIFICVGSTMFTIFSMKIGEDSNPTRIAASIVSGVGFLGAGAIMRDARRIMGLTTAATIWLAAALGMGIGGGYYLLSSVSVGAVLIVLWGFPAVEAWIDNIRETRHYEVICPIAPGRFEELEALFRESGLRLHSGQRIKAGEDMVCTWEASGKPYEHTSLTDRLFEHPGVKEFHF